MVDENSFYRPDLEEMYALAQREETRPHVSQILKETGAYFGVANAVFNDDGISQLEISKQPVSLTYITDQDVLVIKTDVIPIPLNADQEFYTMLMVQNFNTDFEKAGTLAIDKISNSVFLWKRLELKDLTTKDLIKMIEIIIRNALYLKNYLK